MPASAAIVRRFDSQPDDSRELPLGRFDLVRIGALRANECASEKSD